MDHRSYMIILYDYYKELLTTKQQQYFEGYYFENESLQELSENYEVSRNAVHKQVKDAEDKLVEYEKKLGLYQKRIKILQIIDSMDEKIKEQIERNKVNRLG